MTGFGAILKQTTKNKFQTMSKLILTMILADVALSIFMFFTNGTYNFWSSVFGCTVAVVIIIEFVAVGYLCKFTIDETTTNKFRLVPISDTGLYLGSIISNLVNFLYTSLVSGILLYASAIIAYSTDTNFRDSVGKTSINVNEILPFMWISLLFLLIIIAFILLINTSDLLANITMNILPIGKQKVVKVIINLVILFLILKLMSMIDVSNIINTINLNDNQMSILTFVSALLEIILFSVININLLRFVETNK